MVSNFRSRFRNTDAKSEFRQRRRELLLSASPYTFDRTIYHYRHYATSAAHYLNRDDFYIPIGDNRYTCYSWNTYGTSRRTINQVAECQPGLFTPAVTATRNGSGWSSGTNDGCYVSGSPDTAGGTYYSNATNTANIVFNGAYSTGNALCLVIAATSNNGYGIVSLNSNDTGAANLLPKVTAAQTVSGGGVMLDADLGKTYIDFYAGSFKGDVHIPIAENLDEDVQHNLTVTIRGNVGPNGAAAGGSGLTCRFVGLIACRRDSLPTTASHRMARMREINDLGGQVVSAMPVVLGYSPDGVNANYRLMGENHVGTDVGIVIAESQDSHVITDAAGDVVTPVAGTWQSSTSYDIDSLSTLSYGGTARATKHLRYRLRATDSMQVLVTGRINIIVDGYMHATFMGMLPAFTNRYIHSSVYEKTDFNRALLLSGGLHSKKGDKYIPDLTWTSGASIEYPVKGADTIVYFSPNHDTVWLMHTPRPDITVNNWLQSQNWHSFVRVVAQTGQPAPGGLKAYFTRVSESGTGGVAVAIPAGTVLDFEVGWRSMRINRAAQTLLGEF